MEPAGLLLMLMLGLRHGFDPDHIAIIDGVAVRYTATKPASSQMGRNSVRHWTRNRCYYHCSSGQPL
jgi:high-affinity nickel permease